MIALIHRYDNSKLLDKLKKITGREPATERIPTVTTTGRVIVSTHYHFTWLLLDIYIGIPEDSCLIVGSERDIKSLLEFLDLPSNAFSKVVWG